MNLIKFLQIFEITVGFRVVLMYYKTKTTYIIYIKSIICKYGLVIKEKTSDGL